ncbi:zinc-binding alcohol dehydrogenase family protein [Lysinibacillus sp. FSL H8-0500]|uniref:zinc-binding alcohol dehydrogenase family protein n=1 Tax=Lysinibacillus sp. FSL H8-0500 TaxID=2921393 RepID=UPI003101328B
MQQLVINEPFQMIQHEVEKPSIQNSHDVLLKITHIGICGTDTHAFAGEQPFFSYPRVLGHELAAIVEEIGADVTGIQVGDRATVIPYIHCGECAACRRGQTNCCKTIKVLGVHTDGGMGEYIVVDDSIVLVDNAVSGEQLAIVEPLAIGAHAVRRSTLTENDTVLVIGAGPIGLGAARFAKLRGAKTVLMDLNEERLAYGQAWTEADDVIVVNNDVMAQLREKFNGELPTVVFDATGNQKSMEASFEYVEHSGTLVFIGLMKKTITFNDPDFHSRELTLKSSRNATLEDFHTVMKHMQAGDIKEGYVTREIAFEDAIAYFEAKQYNTNKVQIYFK